MEPLSLDYATANDADVAPQNSSSSFSLEASGSRAPTPSNGSTAEAEIIQDIITQDESSATNSREKRPKKYFPSSRHSLSSTSCEARHSDRDLPPSETNCYVHSLMNSIHVIDSLWRRHLTVWLDMTLNAISAIPGLLISIYTRFIYKVILF
ncbi:hypothetical protein PoB_004699000 [Plakobranchus ocellatus]|uniref:Uncharacterized protein n=1 Tax=Plakobranchus ocellatus TaxID=259542 RepID=A0AAV4BJ07_9GAST|nr:hypothetical protein PoB_004699000 [Plakobranchus ocellatus]